MDFSCPTLDRLALPASSYLLSMLKDCAVRCVVFVLMHWLVCEKLEGAPGIGQKQQLFHHDPWVTDFTKDMVCRDRTMYRKTPYI
jgi:hypothetical protein